MFDKIFNNMASSFGPFHWASAGTQIGVYAGTRLTARSLPPSPIPKPHLEDIVISLKIKKDEDDVSGFPNTHNSPSRRSAPSIPVVPLVEA